jgi:hypothetical protein
MSGMTTTPDRRPDRLVEGAIDFIAAWHQEHDSDYDPEVVRHNVISMLMYLVTASQRCDCERELVDVLGRLAEHPGS